jgi:hypothetical protein
LSAHHRLVDPYQRAWERAQNIIRSQQVRDQRFELRRHYVWQMEVCIQDWKSHEGWSQLTKQPGEEGARHSVILSLLVDHSLFVHPDQQDQLKNNLPAYTVGSLRANVQVECLVDVIDDLVSSDEPQEKLQRFTNALHKVFAFGRSKKHMIQRQLGRLEPTPSLKYRADEVMRNIAVMSI